LAEEHALVAVYRSTARYYGEKVRRHGATALGADWRCEPTQQMRFVQLLKLCAGSSACSLNDLGCGYGALLQFLARRRRLRELDYLGVDVSPEMIAAARAAHPRHAHRFVIGSQSPRVAHYSVASGIFNVRLDVPLVLWERFVQQTLSQLRETSRLGFAINFMTPVPATMDSPPQLYRPPLERWPSYIEKELGFRVEPVQGYGLHEITLLARP
jgi:SAM-dependent methyltransferase